MRAEHHVVEFVEWEARRQRVAARLGAVRVVVPDVDAGGANAPVAQRREERLLVDHLASPDVDDDRMGWQQREFAGADQPGGVGRARQHAVQHIGARQQVRQRVDAVHLDGVLRSDAWPPAHADHVHPQRLADGRNAPADHAVAQDDGGFARQDLRPRFAVTRRPIAAAQRLVEGDDQFGRGHHQRDGKFGGGRVVVVQVVQVDLGKLAQQRLRLGGHAGKGYDHRTQRRAALQPRPLGKPMHQNVTVGRRRVFGWNEGDGGRQQRSQPVQRQRRCALGKTDIECHRSGIVAQVRGRRHAQGMTLCANTCSQFQAVVDFALPLKHATGQRNGRNLCRR